jgi:putative autoinducer-2 (AI-2) aldolase
VEQRDIRQLSDAHSPPDAAASCPQDSGMMHALHEDFSKAAMSGKMNDGVRLALGDSRRIINPLDYAIISLKGLQMDWGMSNRISRMIKPRTKRSVMLACDHGYFMGPTHRLENPRRTIEPLLPYADALGVTRGILRNSVDPEWTVPILLRVSGGTSILKEDLSDEEITASMKDAVRLNVSAVALSIFVGSAHEKQSLVNLSRLVDEGEEFGMPVMAITAVGKELEKRDAKYLALACRLAAEIGAHMVKTYYCDDFGKVVEGSPVPLVVAGGPKLSTEEDVFSLVQNALACGAVGVDMGRNIWQNDNPVAVIKGIRAIVHENATVKEALQLFSEEKREKSKKVASAAHL